jgi:hypothetical protein
MVQAIGQKAEGSQDASSDASSEQFAPSNSNAPVRVGSPGGGGDVTQSNSSSAVSAAGNANRTSQDATQEAGPSQPVVVKDDSSSPVTVQAVGQWADNGQSADSSADSTQKEASNSSSPVRIKSGGDDGEVEQSNSSSAKSAAGNLNATDQSTEQSADEWSDVVVQAIGQKAGNDQDASSAAASEQIAPSNANEPVAFFSPGEGGSVEQANDSWAASAAGNRNAICQRAKERTRRVQ